VSGQLSRPATRRQLLRALVGWSAGLAAPVLLAACGGTTAVPSGSPSTSTSSAVPASTAATATSQAASSAATSASSTTTASAATTSSATAGVATSSTTAPTTATTTATTSAATTAASSSGAAAALTFWAFGNTDPSYDAWVQRLADFRKAYPQNPVELTSLSYGDLHQTKLPAAVAAGTPPNVAVYDSILLVAGAARGLFGDISARAQQAGIGQADYQPWSWDMVSIKGKLYGLPYSTDTRMIYVNASHLQQAGIPTTPPKTLEEFAGIAQRLAVKRGDQYDRLGFFPWNDNWSPEGWGFLFGGSYYDAAQNRTTLDDPKVVAAMEWAAGVAAQLGYPAVQAFVGAHKGDLFINQLLSCFIQSTSYLKPVVAAGPALNWAVWPPPPPQGVDHTSTFSGGFSAVMPAGAKNPDASFALLQYVSDAAFQRIEIKTGRFPPLKAVATDPYWETVDPRIKQFVGMLPSSHALPVIPQINIFESELDSKAYPAIISGKQTAHDALTQANQAVNAAIQENRIA